MNSYTDKDIIQGCIDNNRRWQEILYRTYFPKMIAMCFKYTSDEDRAMMIVNDGFMKVFKKIDTFSHKGSFEGWIRRIVYHSMSDYFRKENKYLKFMVLEEKDRAVDQKADKDLYYEDLLTMVEELPNKTQRVFRMYAMEGFNHREIGEKLDISEGTSKWHLSEARKMLKAMIKERDKLFYQQHGG